jgi:uncharacterized protein (UPF0276 family)
MKIGATISPALLSLLNDHRIDVDYIEVNGELDTATLQRALAHRPVLLHDISYRFWLNYEDPFDAATMTKARAMLDMVKPPWHSTGIGASAEPQAHTTDFWRGAPAEALQPRERCLANIVRNGKRLAEWVGIPLLLENFNYHPTNAYEYICEPDTFSQLIEAVGCDVLLDLAHAQISARNMRWAEGPKPSAPARARLDAPPPKTRGGSHRPADTHAYLAKLPLAQVREIHINRPFDDGTQMLDRHQPIDERDLELLRWTLERTPKAEAITLESHLPSEAALLEEVRLLRQVAQ